MTSLNEETWHSVWDVMFLFLQGNVLLHRRYPPAIAVHFAAVELTQQLLDDQCVMRRRENHLLKREKHWQSEGMWEAVSVPFQTRFEIFAFGLCQSIQLVAPESFSAVGAIS